MPEDQHEPEPHGEIVVRGTVSERTTCDRDNGVPFVRARLQREGDESLVIIWWNAEDAPNNGERIIVTGTQRTWNNESQLHANDTKRLRPRSLNDRRYLHPYHRLLWYLIECLEAESCLENFLDPHGRDYIRLTAGRDPAITHDWERDPPVRLPDNVIEFCNRLIEEGEDSVQLGYPIIVGQRTEEGVVQTRVSPLFLVECEIINNEGTIQFRRKDVIDEDLSPYALELLGLNRDEREGIADLLNRSTLIAEGDSPLDRLRCRVELLVQYGVIETAPHLDPTKLADLPANCGIGNTVLVLRRGRSGYVQQLIADLEKLCQESPDVLSQGPLGLLLRGKDCPISKRARPFPTLLPSNYSQDFAVTSAIEQTLSVVTGPPGTGKSQTLVNAIAAAISCDNTVLFASKNNQAVDIVFQRFGELSNGTFPIRTGSRKYRQEAVQRIRTALEARDGCDAALVEAISAWEGVAGDIQKLHHAFHERNQLMEKMQLAEQELADLAVHVPAGLLAELSSETFSRCLTQIKCAIGATHPALLYFLPSILRWWPRNYILRRKQDIRTMIPEAYHDALFLVESTTHGNTTSVEYFKEEKRALLECRRILIEVTRCNLLREKVRKLKCELDRLSSVEELEHGMAQLCAQRQCAGMQYYVAKWHRLLANATATARAAARQLLQNIETLNAGEFWRIEFSHIFAHLLELLPVWAVTNLSARGSFPLKGGLFDLVIIDEASQSDIASLVPLLFRAKRAMIIGDPKQLTHITSLHAQHVNRLAEEWLLTDEQRSSWNYIEANAFELSSQHIDGSPLLLDQHFRCHPAIIQFCNTRFYDSQLVVCTDPSRWRGRPGLRWEQISGEVERTGSGSRRNRAEAERIVHGLENLVEYGEQMTVGIVSPYRAQIDELHRLIQRHPNLRGFAKVATAHQFQGDERDIIIYSPVLSGPEAQQHGLMAARPELVNVAVSRARRLLIIVGDQNALRNANTILGKLANYVSDLKDADAQSPFELEMCEKFQDCGFHVSIGQTVGSHRLALAVKSEHRQLNVECDGHPFEHDQVTTDERDEQVEHAGWPVIRFSPRQIARNLEGCVDAVKERFLSTE